MIRSQAPAASVWPPIPARVPPPVVRWTDVASTYQARNASVGGARTTTLPRIDPKGGIGIDELLNEMKGQW